MSIAKILNVVNGKNHGVIGAYGEVISSCSDLDGELIYRIQLPRHIAKKTSSEYFKYYHVQILNEVCIENSHIPYKDECVGMHGRVVDYRYSKKYGYMLDVDLEDGTSESFPAALVSPADNVIELVTD